MLQGIEKVLLKMNCLNADHKELNKVRGKLIAVLKGQRRKNMEKTVEIPSGVTVKQEGRIIAVTGPRGELSKNLRGSPVTIEISEDKAVVTSDNDRRKVKSHAGTWAAHIRNMIIGVTSGYEAQLKIVYSHFPMKFTVEDKKVTVGNFLGERRDRVVEVKGDVKVENKKDVVTVSGNNREEVGQAAALIELATKVRGFDKRVFQDGIHLTQKASPIEDSGRN